MQVLLGLTPGYDARNGGPPVSAAAAFGRAAGAWPAWPGRPWFAFGRGNRAGVSEFSSMADRYVSYGRKTCSARIESAYLKMELRIVNLLGRKW